jgi:hypothetical protein
MKGSHASIIKCFSVVQNSMQKKKVDVKLSNLPSQLLDDHGINSI